MDRAKSAAPVGERLAGVEKVAVLRANRLGDFIFILPALDALRAAYPQAEIVLLALPWHTAFLSRRRSSVDRVIVVPPYGGVGADPAEKGDQAVLSSFFQAMQEEHFDLACQFHGGGHFSNPFVKRLAAGVTIGLKAEDAVPLDRWIPYYPLQQEYQRYLEVVSLAGARAQSAEPHLTVTEQDLAEVEQVLPEVEQPFAVLHPGAIDPGRRWPGEKFAQVGDALASRGLQVVITGTRDEQEVVARVVDTMRRPNHNLRGRLSLGGLAALLACSQITIANDSGPLHLAHAVGARAVGIYWCFNFVTSAPVSRTRHRPVVSWQIHCPVCGCDRSRNHCLHTASFVDTISADEVIAEAYKLLSL